MSYIPHEYILTAAACTSCWSLCLYQKGSSWDLDPSPISLSVRSHRFVASCSPACDLQRALGGIACCCLDSCHFWCFFSRVHVYIYIYDFSVLVN